MRVYLDLAVLLNFLVDLMLLLGTNRLAGFPENWRRSLIAAALGGLYSGACLLPGFHFLGNMLWRLVSLVGISVIAFGWDPSALKRCGVFLLLTMALGGAAAGLNRNNIPTLLLAAGSIWLLCRTVFTGGTAQEYVPIELTYGEKHIMLTALRDTGNTLRDPISGEQVLVISPEAALRLTGLSREQLAAPLETLSRRPVPGLRLIPYRAVGQGGGFLLGMRVPQVKIGPRKQSAVVAFAAEGFGREAGFQALTGGTL